MEPNILYDSWEDWISHEQWAHRQRIWRCPDHPREEHVDRSSYEDHLRRQHPTTQHQLLSSELLTASESISRSCDRPCPFCKRDFEQSSEMQRHVAGHLESVALLSLPFINEDESSSQADKMASNSANRNYAESRIGDFDETEPLILPENDGEVQRTHHSTEGERRLLKEKLAAEDTLFYKPNESLAEAKATYSKDIVLEWLGYPRETDRSLFPLFRAVDRNQKGHLTGQELGKALVNADFTPFDGSTVQMMIKLFNVDGSGSVNYLEFWYAVSDFPKNTKLILIIYTYPLLSKRIHRLYIPVVFGAISPPGAHSSIGLTKTDPGLSPWKNTRRRLSLLAIGCPTSLYNCCTGALKRAGGGK